MNHYRLLHERLRRGFVRLVDRNSSQIVEYAPFARTVAQLTAHRERLLQQRAGTGNVAEPPGKRARSVQRLEAGERAWPSGSARERGLAPPQALSGVAPMRPEAVERSGEAQIAFGTFRLFEAPAERGAQVVVYDVQSLEPRGLIRTALEVGLGVLGELDEVVAVAHADRDAFPRSCRRSRA